MNNTKNLDAFRQMVRRVLNEEVAKRDALTERSPEMDGNGLDIHKDQQNKRFGSDANTKDTKSKVQIIDELCKLVQEIDKSYSAVWDDHDDLMVNARDLMSIRISPQWEDNYKIETMTRNEDRVWVGGLSWDQVKDFVKTNLTNLNAVPTKVEKAFDKSYRNRKDQTDSPDKGMPQKDKPKTISTDEKPSETKNKDKDYTEKQVKKEADLPNQPMKEVGEVKTQLQHKVQDPVKLRKRKPDTKLTIKL